MSASFVELATVLVEGACDFYCGRPRSQNPYSPDSAADAYTAWTWGWDEARAQLEMRGREETARWLAENDTGPPSPLRRLTPRPDDERPRVPAVAIVIPFEGRAAAVIRGARDEADAGRLRAWIEADDELRELCDLACRVRDRRVA